MALKSINPFSNEEIETFQEMSTKEVNEIIEKSHLAHLDLKKLELDERLLPIKNLSAILKKDEDSLAKIMVKEMGKPIKQAQAEIKKCSLLCEYYYENAKDFLRPKEIKTDAKKSYVCFEPIGIVFGIMPWNFPFWQVFRFAIPSLAVKNTVLLKHAANVSQCALKIEELFLKAGFLKNSFRTLMIEKEHVNNVIKNDLIQGVTLTGSVKAGAAVAKCAGEHIKKTVLELGGSDAYVILEDADIKKAAEICVKSRLLNSGQSCIAAKRFIVVESIKDSFVKHMQDFMKEKKMGDPMEENTDIGPLARNDLRTTLHKQVKKSIENGADCILGGKIPSDKGAFYPPTILTDVTKGMPAYEEELFGPVASIISAKSEEEAIKVANDTEFGLGAAVFTKDLKKGEKIARYKINAGSCFVNDFVRSDPRLPFGGVKKSGYGRELSDFGFKEFTNIKTIYI